MKRSIILLIAILMLVWAVSAVAEPIAPLAPLNDYGRQSFAAKGKTEADVKKEIPSREMVSIPAYPGTFFAMSGKSNGELSVVQLISKDTPEKVIAWYKKQLGEDWQYVPSLAIEEMGQVGVFVNTDDPNVDAFDSLKYKQLAVSKIEKPGDTGFIEMVFDVTGMKSMIVMTVKPMM